jgi:hypothetical protein
VVDELAEAARGPARTEGPVRDHIDHCLRCQAEVVQYRKLLRALRSVRTDLIEPAPGLITDVLVALEQEGERRAVRSAIRGRRAAYVGGIAAATAAGVGGAIVLAACTRRHLSLAG